MTRPSVSSDWLMLPASRAFLSLAPLLRPGGAAGKRRAASARRRRHQSQPPASSSAHPQTPPAPGARATEHPTPQSGARLLMFSLPARSTRLSLPILMTSSPSGVVSFMWIVTVNTLRGGGRGRRRAVAGRGRAGRGARAPRERGGAAAHCRPRFCGFQRQGSGRRRGTAGPACVRARPARTPVAAAGALVEERLCGAALAGAAVQHLVDLCGSGQEWHPSVLRAAASHSPRQGRKAAVGPARPPHPAGPARSHPPPAAAPFPPRAPAPHRSRSSPPSPPTPVPPRRCGPPAGAGASPCRPRPAGRAAGAAHRWSVSHGAHAAQAAPPCARRAAQRPARILPTQHGPQKAARAHAQQVCELLVVQLQEGHLDAAVGHLDARQPGSTRACVCTIRRCIARACHGPRCWSGGLQHARALPGRRRQPRLQPAPLTSSDSMPSNICLMARGITPASAGRTRTWGGGAKTLQERRSTAPAKQSSGPARGSLNLVCVAPPSRLSPAESRLPSVLLRGPPSIVYVFPVPVWP
jgi:hypothetical protein